MHLTFPRRGWVRGLGLLVLALALIQAPRPARAEPTLAPQADLVILLDRSGSMQQNDPQNLALTAASLFVDMLSPTDRIAVIAFDTNARTLMPLAPVGDGTAAHRAITSMGRPIGEWTDLKGALTAAVGALDGTTTPDHHPAVLLLTDGYPQTQDSGVPPGYLDGLHEVVTRLAGRSVPVFTIGLGQADFKLLGDIATQTRAESFAALSAGQVMKLFPDVLSRIKERQVVLSFEEELQPGQIGQNRSFEVPPYTRSLTLSAVGTKGEVRLQGTGPGGTPLTSAPGLKETKGANYTVYTLPNPTPGAYTIHLEGAGKLMANGQLDSALRFDLVTPAPFSQVSMSRPVPVTVSLSGDPDPTSPLELWAQAGNSAPTRLTRRSSTTEFTGNVPFATGDLVLWATRAGQEVARHTFRLYPTGFPTAVPITHHRPWWPFALFGGALGLALIAAGAIRWRQMKRKEEVLGGRIGTLTLAGQGRQAPLGPGPAITQARRDQPIAHLAAHLVPHGWTVLAGLGLVRHHLEIIVSQAPGNRLQVNGSPITQGRIYHGDEVTVGGETWLFQNPPLGRRPQKRIARRKPLITLKG